MKDDIVTRLRTFDEGEILCGFVRDFDGGKRFYGLCREASDEIQRLRAERDEARREICLLRSSSTNATEKISAEMEEYARSRGWDSLEEVKP